MKIVKLLPNVIGKADGIIILMNDDWLDYGTLLNARIYGEAMLTSNNLVVICGHAIATVGRCEHTLFIANDAATDVGTRQYLQRNLKSILSTF
jgi:hypothetical protein